MLSCSQSRLSSLKLCTLASHQKPGPAMATMASSEHKIITFDSEYNVRVLDADKHAASAKLAENLGLFDSKVEDARQTTSRYVDTIRKAADCIEAEKLRAIGLRNRVAALDQEEDSEVEELQLTKDIKQKELESLAQEEKCLQLIIQEQESQLARLKGTAAM